MQPDIPPRREPNPDNKPIDMVAFRNEIEQEVKKAKAGNSQMHNFSSVRNLDELTEEDARLWYIVKNYTKGSVPEEIYFAHKKEAVDSGSETRSAFVGGVIGNILTAKWGEEILGENL